MSTATTLPRSIRLADWLAEHNIRYRDIGHELGISTAAAHKMLKQDTMPTVHHAKCIALGFPPEILPEPYDIKRGRPAGKPLFPGLVASPSLANN